MIFGGKFELYMFLTWGKLNKSFYKLQVIFLLFLQFRSFLEMLTTVSACFVSFIWIFSKLEGYLVGFW